MNDINPTTGYIIPGSYVHVTSTRTESSSEIYLTYTCEIYNLIQRAAQQETPICTEEYVIPNEELICMHCHYYRDHLLQAYEKAANEAPGKLSRPLIMVKESLQYINDQIQFAGNVIDNGTTKFSVWGE